MTKGVVDRFRTLPVWRRGAAGRRGGGRLRPLPDGGRDHAGRSGSSSASTPTAASPASSAPSRSSCSSRSRCRGCSRRSASSCARPTRCSTPGSWRCSRSSSCRTSSSSPRRCRRRSRRSSTSTRSRTSPTPSAGCSRATCEAGDLGLVLAEGTGLTLVVRHAHGPAVPPDLDWRCRDRQEVPRRDRGDGRRRRHPHEGAGPAGAQDPPGRDDRGARPGGGEADPQPRAPTPSFKGYRGFTGSICASPNHMVVHGIPGPYKLKRGDILVRRRRRDQGRLGRRRRDHLPGRRGRPGRAPSCSTPRASRCSRPSSSACPGNHLGDIGHAVQSPRRGRRLLRHPLAGRPRHRPLDARGAADPQLRHARPRAARSRRAWSWPSSR